MAHKQSKKTTVNKTAKKTAKATVPKKAAPKKAAPKKVIKRRKRRKSTDKKKHYVNPKDFYNQICQYYEDDIIPNVLAESINKIAIGLSYAPNFINYSYKDDMIGDAILKMFAALKHKKFNVDAGNNPFSYFTTIAFHAFINRIKKEKKHRETLTNYQEAVYSDMMTEGEGSNKPYVSSDDAHLGGDA
jgi:hypothetical protein